MNLKVAVDTLRSFCIRIQEFRNTGFEKSIADAQLFVEKSAFKIESQLKEKRKARKKQIFGFEHMDEHIQPAETQYKVNFFNTMIDVVIVDTECRFKAVNDYYDRLGFIYDINYLKFLPREDLLKHYNDLGTILRKGENSDIDPFELYEELQFLISTSLENINNSKQLIQYILENNSQEIYQNLYIAIRIMLTIPVTTASSEKSLSKLKLIKTYLKSTISQERQSPLSVLSIDAEIGASVSYDTILKRFSGAKSRKVRLF